MKLEKFKDLAERTSVDYAVKLCKELGVKVPSPDGYNSVSMCDTINVFAPWDKYIVENTLLNKVKVHMIREFANISPNRTAVELGVYMGGTTRMLLDMGLKVFAFDTFEGISGSGCHDFHKNGEFNSGDISDYISGATIVKGKLPFSLETFNEKVGFVHFDLDVYEPTVACIEILWPMLEPNGIMIFDDYGSWTTMGVKKAVDEFSRGRKIYLPTGQMVIMK